jgi:hypothetical protein
MLAKRDAQRRSHILDNLKTKEGKSLRGLTGNKGYSRYLKNTGWIEVDEDRVKTDARYDGKWVIRTNTQDLSGSDLLEAYKMLVNVEQWFSFLKHVVDVKPVYHRLSSHIRSHVFICFLGMKVWHMFREGISVIAPLESVLISSVVSPYSPPKTQLLTAASCAILLLQSIKFLHLF